MPGGDLTHLNFAFLDFDSSGNLVYTDTDAAHKKNVAEGSSYGTVNAGVLPALQELRAKYPNLRIGLSLGGWSKSGDFVAVAGNSASRANLVSNVAKFVEYNNMDFIDVDWEYPGSVRQGDSVDNKNDEGTPNATPGDGKLYVQLLRDIKAKEIELKQKHGRVYELSVALPATSAGLENGAQAWLPSGVTKATATAEQMKAASTAYCTELFSVIDFGNLMTYDMRGAWDTVSGHQAALYGHPSDIPDAKKVDFSVDALVSYLLGKTTDSRGNPLTSTISTGVPANKIVVGAAFYTRGWQQVANNGVDPSKWPGLFGTTNKSANKDADFGESAGANNADPIAPGDGGRAGGVWPYGRLDELKGKYSGLTYYYDEVAEAPYLYKTDGAFFTYDSPRSIAAKTAYVKAHGLGGVISWMASQDAATGDESSGTWGPQRGVLTKAIKQGLFGSAPLKKYKIGASGLNVTATVAAGTSPYNANIGAYLINVKNNFVNSETNNVLMLSAAVAGGVLSPVMYITVKNGVTIPSGTSTGSGSYAQAGNVVTFNFTAYEVRTSLEPGANVDITMVVGAGTTVAVSDIEKIEIAKRIYEKGHEVARAVIYCASGATCSASSGDGADYAEYSCGGNYAGNYVSPEEAAAEAERAKLAKKKKNGATAAVVVVVVLLVVGAVTAGVVLFILYKKGIIFNGQGNKSGGGEGNSGLYTDSNTQGSQG